MPVVKGLSAFDAWQLAVPCLPQHEAWLGPWTQRRASQGLHGLAADKAAQEHGCNLVAQVQGACARQRRALSALRA